MFACNSVVSVMVNIPLIEYSMKRMRFFQIYSPAIINIHCVLFKHLVLRCHPSMANWLASNFSFIPSFDLSLSIWYTLIVSIYFLLYLFSFFSLFLFVFNVLYTYFAEGLGARLKIKEVDMILLETYVAVFSEMRRFDLCVARRMICDVEEHLYDDIY